jgi:hypothetical protein
MPGVEMHVTKKIEIHAGKATVSSNPTSAQRM